MSRPNRGIIDAGSRVLEQVMAKPAFKDDLRALLNNIDPENSPRLIRTMLGRDIEVPLAVMSALPGIANILIRMADELIRQVYDKFPDPLLQGFAESLLAEIDHEALARTVEGMQQLGRDLTPVFQEMLKKMETRQVRTAKGALP